MGFDSSIIAPRFQILAHICWTREHDSLSDLVHVVSQLFVVTLYTVIHWYLYWADELILDVCRHFHIFPAEVSVEVSCVIVSVIILCCGVQ